MAIPAGAGTNALSREGQRLTSVGPAGVAEQLPLTEGATMRPMLDHATAVYRDAAARYPVFPDYFEYRVRATLGIAALLFCQLAGLWPLRRLGLSYRWCSAAATVTWVTAVWWLYYQYLV